MRFDHKLVFLTLTTVCSLRVLYAQDLAPRAYTITPVHANAVTFTYGFYSGGLEFNEAIPVVGGTGEFTVPTFTYYHSFRFFGRSANILTALPYGVGNFEGSVVGVQRKTYRSGMLDSVFRFSVNLKGGPAMELPKFMKWKQSVLLGASLKVIAPTGQYDSTKLINWSINRWAFKPEIGYSQRFGNKWLLDGYAGVWFFSTNPDSFSIPAPQPQTRSPMGSFESHFSRDFRPMLWASIDGNFWFGGTATTTGIANPKTKETSSRIGATVSFPLRKHQTIKVSYSTGVYYRFGGDYENVSVGWQYSWLGRPN